MTFLGFGSSLFGLPRMRLPVVSDSLSARLALWASATLEGKYAVERGGQRFNLKSDKSSGARDG